MFHSLSSLARKACAVSVLLAALGLSAPAVFAENNDATPPDKAAPAGQEPAKENQGLAQPPAFRNRHLDLYDRFGCPSAHIQATFRCLIQHGNNIDPKVADTLNGRVLSCWVNPTNPSIQTPPPPPAAANGTPPASH